MQSESMSSSDETIGDSESPSTKSYAERRKSSKPIMEKRRRARINSSLNELKSILLDALKKDTTRHSKLEKADILEMTVKYLKNVERQRMSVSLSIDPAVVDKYKAGFNECRNEVMRFLSTCEGVTVNVRTRLLSHLAACLQSIQSQPGIFDDSNFDCHNPISSGLLINGHNQPIQLAMPETGFYPASIAPRLTPSTQYHPVFDPKLTVIKPRVSTPIVLKEGIHLTSSLNALGPGNITLLLPTNDGGNTATFFTTPLSSAHTNISPERPRTKVASPPTKSPKESAKATQKSPSLLSDIERKQASPANVKPESKSTNQVKPVTKPPGKLRKILSNPLSTSHADLAENKIKVSASVSDKNVPNANDDHIASNNIPELPPKTITTKNSLTRTQSGDLRRKRTSSDCDVISSGHHDSGVVGLSSPKRTRIVSSETSRDRLTESPDCHSNSAVPNITSSLTFFAMNTVDTLAEHQTKATCVDDVSCRRSNAPCMTSKGNPWRPWSKSNLISDT